MNIQLTDAAAEKIHEKTAGQRGRLKLKYDIDGCGCVVSGVPTLWYVSEPDEIDDVTVETDHFPILVEKSKMVFLDEELKIDFSTASNTFQLKSPGQILNGRMNFVLYPGE
ncbi:iron-sulfur cluster biosynthesis family protein [Lysinibacillus sphaericus]